MVESSLAAEFLEQARLLLQHLQECKRCHGSGKISERYGVVYETDTEEERRLAYYDKPCPECRPAQSIAHALQIAELRGREKVLREFSMRTTAGSPHRTAQQARHEVLQDALERAVRLTAERERLEKERAAAA